MSTGELYKGATCTAPATFQNAGVDTPCVDQQGEYGEFIAGIADYTVGAAYTMADIRMAIPPAQDCTRAGSIFEFGFGDSNSFQDNAIVLRNEIKGFKLYDTNNVHRSTAKMEDLTKASVRCNSSNPAPPICDALTNLPNACEPAYGPVVLKSKGGQNLDYGSFVISAPTTDLRNFAEPSAPSLSNLVSGVMGRLNPAYGEALAYGSPFAFTTIVDASSGTETARADQFIGWSFLVSGSDGWTSDPIIALPCDLSALNVGDAVPATCANVRTLDKNEYKYNIYFGIEGIGGTLNDLFGTDYNPPSSNDALKATTKACVELELNARVPGTACATDCPDFAQNYALDTASGALTWTYSGATVEFLVPKKYDAAGVVRELDISSSTSGNAVLLELCVNKSDYPSTVGDLGLSIGPLVRYTTSNENSASMAHVGTFALWSVILSMFI